MILRSYSLPLVVPIKFENINVNEFYIYMTSTILSNLELPGKK